MVMIMVMIVVVVMVMMVIMIVVMVMMIMLVIVPVLMVMLMIIPVPALFQMSVQILHVVVVAVMFLVEDHIEVTAVDAGLLHPADPDLKSVSGNPVEHSKELVRIRSQIQKRRDRHIAADPGPTFQIKDPLAIIHSFLRKPGD
jgi:hypothetical protein